MDEICVLCLLENNPNKKIINTFKPYKKNKNGVMVCKYHYKNGVIRDYGYKRDKGTDD